MSEFDLTKITEGMTPEEGIEFISSLLTKEAATKFIANKRGAALKERYDKEMATVTNDLGQFAKINKMSAIKSKYRKLGLDVG